MIKQKHILVAAILAMCLARIPFSLSVRFSFQMAVECGVMLFFAWVLSAYANRYVGIAFAAIVLSSVIRYDLFSYLTCRAVFMGMFWYWVVVKYYDEIILDGICIIAVCNVIMLVLQYFNMDPLYTANDGGKDQLVGLMANPNEVSALLAICSPAFLRKDRYFGLAIVCIGLLASKSFGGFVSAAAGVSFFMILRGYKFYGSILPVAGIFAYLLIDTPTIQHRINAWQVGMELYCQKWFLGYGIGHWAPVFIKQADPRLGGSVWQYAHNEFIQGLFEIGPVFILIIIAYCTNVFLRIRKLYQTVPDRILKNLHLFIAGLVVVFVNAGVNFVMHIATTAILSITMMAALEYKIRELE